jgi:hypothetical protein
MHDPGMTKSFRITPLGALSTRESVEFGVARRDAGRFHGVLRPAPRAGDRE